MSKQVGYVVRPWGEGYWRWSCTGRGRSGDHWGIVGPPFKREDAERMAQEHLADAHANPGQVRQGEPEDQAMDVYPGSPDEPGAPRALAIPFIRHSGTPSNAARAGTSQDADVLERRGSS